MLDRNCGYFTKAVACCHIWDLLQTTPQISPASNDHISPATWVAGHGQLRLCVVLCAAVQICCVDPTDQVAQVINTHTKGNHAFIWVIDFIDLFQPITASGFRSPKTVKSNTLITTQSFMQTTPVMSQAKTLTPEEVSQVLDFIATQNYPLRNRVMLLTGLWSGMRVGEIASLRIQDLLNADGTVRAEVRLGAQQTKGRHARTVFLPQKLRDELADYIALRQPCQPLHPVFVTAGRRPFSANVMAQHFHYLFKHAGIAGASSHSMRRTFITTLANKGIGVRVLASLAGHRSIAITQRYIDVNDDMKRNAVELV